MAALLDEIAWSEPVLPRVEDKEWEAIARKKAGSFGEVYRRTAPLKWLREAMLALDTELAPTRHLSAQMAMLGTFVVAQENACRYCYGSVRALMRMIGHSEKEIDRIERDIWLSEAEDKSRAYIRFCRNLARSRPRPTKQDREHLLAAGFSEAEICEAARHIALTCFYNRVNTFIACPPEEKLERFPNSILGRMVSLAGPLLLKLMVWRMGAKLKDDPAAELEGNTLFGRVLAPVSDLPMAAKLQEILVAMTESEVLPLQTKALIFTVVARALECRLSENEARAVLQDCGMTASAIDTAIDTLRSPNGDPSEEAILNWARSTVHYEPASIQQQTRQLAVQIGETKTLEAIGVASMANALVRLAMLQV